MIQGSVPGRNPQRDVQHLILEDQESWDAASVEQIRAVFIAHFIIGLIYRR